MINLEKEEKTNEILNTEIKKVITFDRFKIHRFTRYECIDSEIVFRINKNKIQIFLSIIRDDGKDYYFAYETALSIYHTFYNIIETFTEMYFNRFEKRTGQVEELPKILEDAFLSLYDIYKKDGNIDAN